MEMMTREVVWWCVGDGGEAVGHSGGGGDDNNDGLAA
nr:hypothetical protein [Tanacetum cinerariifolium]